MKKDERSLAWWGEFSFHRGETKSWRVGPLKLHVLRARREWRISCERSDPEETEGWEILEDVKFPDESAHVERFAFTETTAQLTVLPALADRPMVTSPRIPLRLAPNEEATLFVSSPLWVRVLAQQPLQLLCDIPIHRPSDTWFGPSSLDGEVCYATRTRAVLEAENVPLLQWRAVTPVRIQNESDRNFPVERLKLPVPYLSLYSSKDCQLQTEEVKVVHREETGLEQVELGIGSPAEGRAGELVSTPREMSQPSMLVRVFSTIFRLDF